MLNSWLTALTVEPKVVGVSCDVIIGGHGEDKIQDSLVWKPIHL